MISGDSLPDDIVGENEIILHSLTHSHLGFNSVVLSPLATLQQTVQDITTPLTVYAAGDIYPIITL